MEEDKNLRYLIDIGHPAHVHYFKNFAHSKIRMGADVLFTCRNKDITVSLLESYGFRYINLGRNYKSLFGKIFGLFYFTLRLFFISITYKPDFFLNATINSAITSWLFRKPHIAFEDTFNKEQVNLFLPFTSCVLTGSYPHPKLGRKEINYNGYQELLYLHPNHFTPDPIVLDKLGINKNEKYVVVRFVSWNASHDIGHSGITLTNKIKAVEAFSKHARVFISSEEKLPNELAKYTFMLPPKEMHNAIAFASLVFGESATMATEAAMLGIPSIYLDNTGRYYTTDLEKKYGIIHNYSESENDQIDSIEKGIELLSSSNLKLEWNEKRNKLLQNNIDVTAFLNWFISDWPQSFQIMKHNPNHQNIFISK